MNAKQGSKFFIFALVAALVLAACGAPAKPADNVVVQLSWFHGVEYAGFYAAVEKGYYAAENLSVTLNPGGPETSPLDEVNSGRAQFGIGQGDALITAKTQGQNLMAVAAIFKKNPVAIVSLAKDNIQKPEDLIGKTVGTYSLDLTNFSDFPYVAFLNRTGLQKDQMKYALIEDFQGVNEIKAGKMDVMSSIFATDMQVMTQQAGDEVNLMYYSDYGVDLYANALFTTEDLVKNNPDLVARFVRATLKGYQYAIENTDEMAKLALTYDSSLDLAYQQQVMQAEIPYINTGDGQIGEMSESVWNTTQEILLDFNVIQKPIDLNTIYTNQFVTQK
ncbi:MAG: ABC transporter substrate-binding protein [Anaerolineales bacterium]|nr:ABC transporter substrate-binding protein [Anaerolineales bacterium]